jgi:hypothetical protein
MPPTPVPRTAMKDARVTKFGDPPAAIPNRPAMRRVRLKDQLGVFLFLKILAARCTI